MEPTVQLITPTYLGGFVHPTAHYNVQHSDAHRKYGASDRAFLKSTSREAPDPRT